MALFTDARPRFRTRFTFNVIEDFYDQDPRYGRARQTEHGADLRLFAKVKCGTSLEGYDTLVSKGLFGEYSI